MASLLSTGLIFALLTGYGVAAQCNFCNGETLSRPDLIVPFTKDGSDEPMLLSCHELPGGAATTVLPLCPDDDAMEHLLYACGCPSATAPGDGACGGLCQEGSPSNPDVTPFGSLIDGLGPVGDPFEIFRYATCEFAHLILKHEAKTACTAIQNFAGISEACGCPVALPSRRTEDVGTCGVCGFGVELPEYSVDSEITPLLESYCKVMDARLEFDIATPEDCEDQLEDLMGFQGACLCPGAPPPEAVDFGCSICPGGLEPLNPDQVLFAVDDVLGSGSTGLITCGEATSLLEFLVLSSNITCYQFETWGTLLCDCPTPEGALGSICPQNMTMQNPENSIPEVVKDVFVGGLLEFDEDEIYGVRPHSQIAERVANNDVSCETLGTLALLAAQGPTFYQTTVPLDCGCPEVSERTCSVCSRGSLPDASIDLDGDGLTCGYLDLQIGLADEITCAGTQLMGPYCDCPSNDVSAACRVCGDGDGDLVIDQSRQVEFLGIQYSCFEIEAIANLEVADAIADGRSTETVCSFAQQEFGDMCCVSSFAAAATDISAAPPVSATTTDPTATPTTSPTESGTATPYAYELMGGYLSLMTPPSEAPLDGSEYDVRGGREVTWVVVPSTSNGVSLLVAFQPGITLSAMSVLAVLLL